MDSECERIFSDLGTSQEWKTIQVFPTFTAMVHRITCHVLLGEDLTHSEDLIEESRQLNRSLSISTLLIEGVAWGPSRNLVAWLAAIKHRTHLAWCTKYLKRKIEEIRGQPENHNGTVRWMVELVTHDKKEVNPGRTEKQLMHLVFAGSGAPGGLVVQMIYQILMSPKYLAPLRKEIADTLEETGGFTTTSLSRTPLTESFVREAMRLYPTGMGKQRYSLRYLATGWFWNKCR
jgi:cytochrome P450